MKKWNLLINIVEVIIILALIGALIYLIVDAIYKKEKLTASYPIGQNCFCPGGYQYIFTPDVVKKTVKDNCGYDVVDVTYGDDIRRQVKWIASNGKSGSICGPGSAPCKLDGINC